MCRLIIWLVVVLIVSFALFLWFVRLFIHSMHSVHSFSDFSRKTELKRNFCRPLQTRIAGNGREDCQEHGKCHLGVHHNLIHNHGGRRRRRWQFEIRIYLDRNQTGCTLPFQTTFLKIRTVPVIHFRQCHVEWLPKIGNPSFHRSQLSLLWSTPSVP